MTNVGNLNATLTLSQFEFNSGLRSSETAAMEFATTVEQQSRRADVALSRVGKSSGGIGNKIGQPLQQIGFGLQDAMSQFETRGWAGAVGAATNNVQQLGASFGPAAMAATALGGAIAGMVLPRLIESGHIFGNTREELDRMAKSANDAANAFAMMQKGKRDISDWESLKDADRGLKGINEQILMNSDKQESMKRSIKEAESALAQAKREAAGNWFDDGSVMRAEQQVQALRTELQKLSGEGAGLKTQKDRGILRKEELKLDDIYDQENKLKAKAREEEYRLRRKSIEDYGTAMQREEAKIAKERERLMGLGVNKEAMQRFEAQSKVELARAKITDDERKLSELGAAAGMAPGSLRNSAAGVTAINRAASGTNSEQSIARESLKTQKDALKKLEEIARQGGQIKQVALSG